MTTATDSIETHDNSLLTRLSDDLAAAVERAGEWTVRVNARRRMAAGGIVWRDDGLSETANHVVGSAESISLGLSDGRNLNATLLGRDPGSDIALLQVEATGLTAPPRISSPPKVGTLALAVARPGPSGPMASFGVISVVGLTWRTQQGSTFQGFLRADVAMLPGFSGGPLVDPSGQLIGLNSSTLGRGSGLTVPNDAIDQIVGSLRAHGKVRRGFLGVGAQAVKIPAGLASAAGIDQDAGLVIVNVEPGGPADQHGLLLGDVIVSLNGEPLTSVEALQDRLSGDWVGKAIPITIIRGGRLEHAQVTVGERS
jgi:S1-C subfamily serine protease